MTIQEAIQVAGSAISEDKTFFLLFGTVLVSATKWLVERQKRLEAQNDYMPKLISILNNIQKTQERLVTRCELNEIRNERVFSAILRKLDDCPQKSDNAIIRSLSGGAGC